MKPNVVLIDCHDLGDWLGCYGQDWLRTANIDRLAKEGMCFENHFAPSPQCIPSRMGIYCSRYAHTHDVYGQMPPSDEPLFMAQQFSQHGYQTTLSNHLNMPVTPEQAGFQMRTSTPPTTQGTAQEFFSHADSSGKSFFVHFSFGLVHRPFGQEFDAERVPTLPVPEVLPDTIITRRDLATLASQVEQLDTAVGWILSALDEAGLNDQTIV